MEILEILRDAEKGMRADCLEETTVKTDAGVRRRTTESVAGDRLFLELLGVSKS